MKFSNASKMNVDFSDNLALFCCLKLLIITVISNGLVEKPVCMYAQRKMVTTQLEEVNVTLLNSRHHADSCLVLVKLPLDLDQTLHLKNTLLTFNHSLWLTNKLAPQFHPDAAGGN